MPQRRTAAARPLVPADVTMAIVSLMMVSLFQVGFVAAEELHLHERDDREDDEEHDRERGAVPEDCSPNAFWKM